ncbi:DNA-binding protein [Streptomyces flavofungini]|uniref:DNA-binding protein n=1 Tax=Streptomyces flavofungini TaxID=68200 RepID=UPI0025B150A4|nr:DNA-binding protein [Streptomyces flavofungini]WJV48978.1 DNA-binding protein [Streptomyces flavofungini]
MGRDLRSGAGSAPSAASGPATGLAPGAGLDPGAAPDPGAGLDPGAAPDPGAGLGLGAALDPGAGLGLSDHDRCGHPRPGLEALRAVTRRLIGLDSAGGGVTAVPLARAVVRAVPEVTADPASLAGAGSDRLAVLAELCEVIGWVLFDAGLHGAAHRMNARALALAELCGDRWTARLTLLNDSMLLAHIGQPRAALAAAARARGPRPLPPRVAALVRIREAHATAMRGARREPAELMARAGSLFLDGVSGRDPAWAWWLDERELTGHRGWVAARLGDFGRAVPLLRRAATASGDPSYRHLFTAHLLAALTGAGAWTDAELLVADLAPRAADIGSARTTERLRGTARRVLHGPDRVPASARDAAVHLLESLPPQAPAQALPDTRPTPCTPCTPCAPFGVRLLSPPWAPARRIAA